MSRRPAGASPSASCPIAERYESVALAGFTAAEADILKAALRRLYRNMEALER